MVLCCASALCCAGRCCGSLCGVCSACGVKSKSMPRLAYVFLQISLLCVSFSIMYSTDFVDCFKEAESDPLAPDTCYGVSVMFRMTFALFIFHLVILLMILPRNDCSSVIHDGGWCFKFLIVMAIFIGFLYVPISFWQKWAEACRYLSVLFMVM